MQPADMLAWAWTWLSPTDFELGFFLGIWMAGPACPAASTLLLDMQRERVHVVHLPKDQPASIMGQLRSLGLGLKGKVSNDVGTSNDVGSSTATRSDVWHVEIRSDGIHISSV
jgi:hypothetical protein